MASKYAAVFARLKRVLGPDPKHQERVDVVKQAIVNEPTFLRHGSALALRYAEVRLKKDKIVKELSDCQVELDAVSQLMADQFEVESVTSVNFTGGGGVRVEPGIHPKIFDPEAFRQWC